MKSTQQITVTERALLVGVAWKRSPRFPGQPAGVPERESLAELVELARSAGADVAGTVFQLRAAADPATWGDAEEAQLTSAIMASPTLPDTMDTVRNWPNWTVSNPYAYALDLSSLPAAERTLRANRGSFRLSVP